MVLRRQGIAGGLFGEQTVNRTPGGVGYPFFGVSHFKQFKLVLVCVLRQFCALFGAQLSPSAAEGREVVREPPDFIVHDWRVIIRKAGFRWLLVWIAAVHGWRPESVVVRGLRSWIWHRTSVAGHTAAWNESMIGHSVRHDFPQADLSVPKNQAWL
jgi:hypothetical protein